MGALTGSSHHRKSQSHKIGSTISHSNIIRSPSARLLVLLSITVILYAQRAQTIESTDVLSSPSLSSRSFQQQITGNEDFTFSKNGSFLQIDAGREWPFNSKREISFRFKTKSPHGLLVYQTFDHNKLQRDEDQESPEIPNPANPADQQPNDIAATTPLDIPNQSLGKLPAVRQQSSSEQTKPMGPNRVMRRRRRRRQAITLQQVTTTLEPEVRHLNSRTGTGSLSQLSSSTITATASEKLVNSLFSSSHISTINGNNPARNPLLMSNQQTLLRADNHHHVLMAANGGGGGGGVTLSRDQMAISGGLSGAAASGGGRNRLLNSLVATLNAAAAAESNVRVANYGSSLRSPKPVVESASDGSPVLSSSAINSLSASLYELYIKLENGRLKIVYEFGSRLNQTYCGKSLNDDRWHRVDLKVDPEINQMILTLDQVINVEIALSQVNHEEDSTRRNELVFTNSILYLGGLNNNASLVKNVRQRLYLAQFIGCIGQILLKTDQSTEATLQPAPLDNMVYVKRGCLNLCDTRNYCLHKSTCVNYYTHTKCDCFGTSYEDVYCWQEKLTTLTMLGYSTMVYRIYDWRDRHHSNSNRFSLQFKTLARDSILFFAYGDLSTQQAMRNPINYSQSIASTGSTSNLVNLGYSMSATQVNISSLSTIHRPQSHQTLNNNNYLAISLINGSLVVEISFGDQPVLLSNLLYDKMHHNYTASNQNEQSDKSTARPTPIRLSDDQWHNVTLVHQGKQLTLYLDRYSVNYTLTGKNSHLYFDPSIYVGGVPNFLANETRALLRPINLRYKFVGCLRSIYFNQQNVLLDLKQGSQMVEYRDLLGKPLLDVCDVRDPNSLPLTLRSGKSYLTFQLSPGPPQSAALHGTSKTSEPLIKGNSTGKVEKTGPTQSSEATQVSPSVTRKLTWIEFEYKTALTKHFLAGGHLRDLSYHDLGGFWTLQAREECSLYFTISSGLTFDPEQVLVLASKEKKCEPGQWFKVTISIMSGDKALNISRYPVGDERDGEKTQQLRPDHGTYTLSSSVELLHQVQIGGDLAKYGESSPIPFSGCVRRIIINGHSFDSRDFVTTQSSSMASSAITSTNQQQNMTMNQLAQVTQYDVISSRMAQGYVTVDSCRLVNPCATLNPCKNGGVCKISDLGEPDCDCSKTGYTGRRCHFSTYKKSCQDIYLSGQRKSSFYLIDLDRNGPLKPVRVRCNMDSGLNNVETSLAHNLPAEYLIRRSQTSDIFLDITYLAFHHMYTHDGFYVHDDSDEAARTQQDVLLRALIGQSTFCKQHVRFECRSDPLYLGNRTWMEVAYPRRHKLLSLDGQNSGKCACASAEKRCLDPSKGCNCDSGESIWSDDSHDLIGQEQVGLTRIVLLKHNEEGMDYQNTISETNSRTNLKNNLGTVESQSRLSLGDLKCYGTRERGNQHEITFKTSDAYIEVPGWRRGDISFNFRTASSPPAIILYQLATSRNHGYFRLTLITDTRLLFEFIVNRRPRRLFLTASHRLNNGEWQQVFIEYDSANIRLTVNDDSVLVDLDPNDHLGTFEGPLFIGGAPSKYLVGDLTRRNGFTGCFKGLNINGRSIDLNDYLSSTMPTVISGCRPSCTKNLCQNGGKCIEYWGSYECECSNAIAHSGSNCEINLNTNSITFITPESHYVEQASDTLTYPPYLIKSILLNIRTYQETALVLYALDQFNNFIQLHKNGTNLVMTFNSNATIVTARVPIVDETATSLDSTNLPATSALGLINLAAQGEPQVTILTQQVTTTTQATNLTNLTVSATTLNLTAQVNLQQQQQQQQLNTTTGAKHPVNFDLDRSSIRSSNTSGSGQPIQIKIERHRLRTTFYVNNNFIVIEKPLILLTNYTQYPWINPELELVRPIRPRTTPPKLVSRIFLANIDEHFVTRIPGFAGCIQGFSIDNQLFDFNRAHLTGELKGDYKIGCKMHCDSYPCKNQGTCVENWIEDKIQCKCDTTSYVGRLCDEDIAAIFNGATSHLIYNLDRKSERLIPTTTSLPVVPPSQAVGQLLKSNETTHAQSASTSAHEGPNSAPNATAAAAAQSSSGTNGDRAVNFLEVSLAFSSETNHSLLEPSKPGVQVLVWVTFANTSRHFFLGLTSDGGLLIQEDYGNSMSLSRLIKKPDQLFNDGYRHMVKYSRFNQTIQILVDHQAYLPTMSVIASSRMNRHSRASLISVGTPLNDPDVSKLIAREANPVEDEFVRYSGCISNLIMKIDGSTVEPLSEAFGHNLETVNVTTAPISVPTTSAAETKPAPTGRSQPPTHSIGADGGQTIARTRSGIEPNDDFTLTGTSDESRARARLLNVVDKESKQDVKENMETIVARDVEQGRCASFKRVENSNEKRSVNEPKFTQLLDPRPAYMDPPRMKLYNRRDGSMISARINRRFDFGLVFYCSITLLVVVGGTLATYACFIQARYKSEKFRCETPFFHNKRDELSGTPPIERTPSPGLDESSDDSD